MFEDLVEDLKKENLLDDSVNSYSNVGNNIFVYKSVKTDKKVNLVVNEVNQLFKQSTPKFSNFTLNIQPQIDNFANETPAQENSSVVEADSTKKLRKVPIKNKRKSRYCKTCMIGVPRHRLSCRFCGEKIAGSYFYYYLALIPLILSLLGLITVLIIKNYI